MADRYAAAAFSKSSLAKYSCPHSVCAYAHRGSSCSARAGTRSRRLVFLLQAETVSEHAPRLRRQSIQRRRLLRQVRQPRLALQMPQHRRVHLHPLQPMRIHRARARANARSASPYSTISACARPNMHNACPVANCARGSRESASTASRHRNDARWRAPPRLRHRREERERRRRALREPTEPAVDARRGGIASRVRASRERFRV